MFSNFVLILILYLAVTLKGLSPFNIPLLPKIEKKPVANQKSGNQQPVAATAETVVLDIEQNKVPVNNPLTNINFASPYFESETNQSTNRETWNFP